MVSCGLHNVFSVSCLVFKKLSSHPLASFLIVGGYWQAAGAIIFTQIWSIRCNLFINRLFLYWILLGCHECPESPLRWEVLQKLGLSFRKEELNFGYWEWEVSPSQVVKRPVPVVFQSSGGPFKNLDPTRKRPAFSNHPCSTGHIFSPRHLVSIRCSFPSLFRLWIKAVWDDE